MTGCNECQKGWENERGNLWLVFFDAQKESRQDELSIYGVKKIDT